MSPSLSTPANIELGLANHHDLQVKELQPYGDDAQSPSCGLSNHHDLQTQPDRNDAEVSKDVQVRSDDTKLVEEVQARGGNAESVKGIQPEVKKVLSHQEKAQAELDEWRKFRFRKTSSPKIQASKQDSESSQDIRRHDEEVNALGQQKQVELDARRDFQKAHDEISKMQSSKENVDSVQEIRPEGNDTESFSEQGQRELDEWREFRKAHYPIPTNPVNPVKILNDLLDMGYPASEAPARVVEGVSAWKKKKGRKSGYRVKYV